jgi:hypothetical protein
MKKESKMIQSICDKIENYLDRDILKNYRIKEELISDILDILKKEEYDDERRKNAAVMRYLLEESYNFHSSVSDEKADNSYPVIYGDYFGMLYHRVVIDSEEFESNENLVSEYKKRCIEAFEKMGNR